MLEQFLVSGPASSIADNSDLPFPAGTPFKGVVSAKNFIDGVQLADQIGLVAGLPVNKDAGWLHFIEDNGYNIYIAKKPIRYNLTWEHINTAQLGKEIILGGKTFLVEFISGMRYADMAASPANSGGAWNRYMYNVYNGERKAELPGKLNWGPYTEKMLGIPADAEDKFQPGAFSFVKESVTNSGGHATRGVYYPGTTGPNISGVWYGVPNEVATHYGWRPMLVEKGTVPPPPESPFKGEVAQADFITFAALSTLVGVTEGTAINTTAPWLKIVEDGTTYYWPKASIRSSVLRETLNTKNLVTGNTTKVINGLTYKVRLIKGRAAAVSDVIGAEWLDWVGKLVDGTWANYTAAQLVTGTGGVSNGELVLVQEKASNGGWAANGYPNLLTTGWYQDPNATHGGYGWRPVLELVP